MIVNPWSTTPRNSKMLRVFLCLLIASSSYADLDIGSAVGGVVDKEVSGAVKDGVSGVVGDEIGGQIGNAAGELAGSVVKCYIDGILTTGKGCPDADLEAAAGKAAGDLLGDLGNDLKNAADKEIDKVAGSISNGIGGELGSAVGGAVGDALKDVVKDVAAADKSTDCVTMKSYCKNAFYEKMMAEMCPKTCGASGSAAPAQPAATPAPAPVTSAPAPAAVDKTPQCASMKAYCNNASYKKMMTEQCPKTCGITTPPTSSGSTSTGTSGSSASGSTGTGSSSSGTSGSTSGSGSSSSGTSGSTSGSGSSSSGTSGSTSGSGSSSSGTSGSSSSSSSGSSSSSSGVKQEAPCTNEGGMCKFDTDCSDGTLKSGLCPTQAANVKCCVPKSGSSGSEAPVTAGGYGKGVDVSDLTTVEQFNCLKKEGFNLAIVRVYRNANGGSPDTNALTTMKNAKAAGFYVEIYHFPNPSKNGATQFDEMYNHVTGGGWTTKFVWLDVENIAAGTGWSSDKTANRKVIQDFVDRASAKGVGVGIYSKDTNWPDIVGSWEGPSAVSQIWFWKIPGAGQLGTLSTTDFAKFGHWNYATMKQYGQDHSICGIKADLNVYPTTGSAAHVLSDLAVSQK